MTNGLLPTIDEDEDIISADPQDEEEGQNMHAAVVLCLKDVPINEEPHVERA